MPSQEYRALSAVKAVQLPVDEIDSPPDLRSSVRAAVAAMDWLKPSDRGLADLAIRMADEIETTVERAAELRAVRKESGGDPSLYRRLQLLEAMCNQAQVVGLIGPQLQSVLKDLGGNPAAREALKVDRPIGGRLAQLRADAAG